MVVVDNGSSDATAQVAASFGATVVFEPVPGYGRACLAGLASLRGDPPAVVAFVDADGSDDLSHFPELIVPVRAGEVDLMLGRRVQVEKGALSFQQRFGHVLATSLIRIFWGHRFRDLGPMRAIRWDALEALAMQDQAFGWTVEMQVRAVRHGLKTLEIRVPYYQRRAGKSKISRTLAGTIKAGNTILRVIGRELLADVRQKRRLCSCPYLRTET